MSDAAAKTASGQLVRALNLLSVPFDRFVQEVTAWDRFSVFTQEQIEVCQPVFEAIHQEGREVSELLFESLAYLPMGRLSAGAIQRFNASIAPLMDSRLRLEEGEQRTTAAVDTFRTAANGERNLIPGSGGLPGQLLWRVILVGELHHVKRCRVCQRWFSDESKNVSAKHCSTTCTNRYWNRTRRRIEGGRRKKTARRR